MIHGIDHVVILVDELEAAIACYRALGFAVTPGGRHPSGTHNALVCFRDGSYLELIAFWDGTDHAHPFHRQLAHGPGIIAYALAADGLDETVVAVRSRGVRYGAPEAGERQRPDGVEIAWKMAFVEGAEGLLPFLIEDVTERVLRVPDRDAAEHTNGVVGIAQVLVAGDDLSTAIGPYAGLSTATEARQEETAFDQSTRSAVFQVGVHRIELHEPQGSGPITDRLAARGSGLYAVVLEGPNTQEIQPDASGGARLRIAPRVADN